MVSDERDMRAVIAGAIVGAFERTYRAHGSSYDPDTCYEAADDVIAELMTVFSGQPVLAQHPVGFIGQATFRIYDRVGER